MPGCVDTPGDRHADAGLPGEFANAIDDASWDDEIGAETDEALALTGNGANVSSR